MRQHDLDNHQTIVDNLKQKIQSLEYKVNYLQSNAFQEE